MASGPNDVRDAAEAIRLRADSIILRLLDGDLDEEIARVCDELLMTQVKALGLEKSARQGREEERKKGGVRDHH